eukprot:14843170-Alexandrium_andersonii.AAC.1
MDSLLLMCCGMRRPLCDGCQFQGLEIAVCPPACPWTEIGSLTGQANGCGCRLQSRPRKTTR